MWNRRWRAVLAGVLAGTVFLLVSGAYAWAEPSASPTPVIGTPSAAPRHPTSSRVAPNADLRSIKVEVPECFEPRSVRISADLDDFAPRGLGWVLHGPSGVVDSGSLPWIADGEMYDPLDLALEQGRYRLIITLADEDRVVVDDEFDVLHCVTVEDGCHAVTFTNPAGNPAVRVSWGPGIDSTHREEESAKGGEMTLEPGESRVVDLYWVDIHWEASGPEPELYSGPNAGEEESSPAQHCGATMTRGVVRCAPAGDRGVVEAQLSPSSDRGLRYRLTGDYGEFLGRGKRVGADGQARLELGPGYYTFRSYTADNALPYDRAAFIVPPCVTAIQKCHAVTFKNPSDEKVAITYRRDDETRGTTIRLAYGRAKTVAVASGTLIWKVAAYESDALWTIKPGRGSIRIDQTCPSPSVSPNDPDKLPATGGPAPWWWAGLAGVTIGAWLLMRNRANQPT